MSERCPDCGRRITESHTAFTEQWERAGSEELCFPYVNFGGTELCAERTVELLRSRIAKLEAVVAAQAKVIGLADSLTMLHRATRMAGLDTPALDAFDAAKAELEREQGGET